MSTTTLYRFYDTDDQLLYVGITKNGAQRWHEHSKSKEWFRLVERVTVEHYDTRAEALRAEERAIRAERPRHNVVHNAPQRTSDRRSDTPPNQIPTFDFSGLDRGVLTDYVAAMKSVDRLIQTWRDRHGTGMPPGLLDDAMYALEVSDGCDKCLGLTPPVAVHDNGECWYWCEQCERGWRCWWNRDRNLLAEVR